MNTTSVRLLTLKKNDLELASLDAKTTHKPMVAATLVWANSQASAARQKLSGIPKLELTLMLGRQE